MSTQTLKKLSKSAKEVNKSDFGNKEIEERTELIEKHDMPDSPFTVVTIGEESFGVMGGYRLTEKAESKEEVIAELNKITWNRIIQVVMLLGKINEDKKA